MARPRISALRANAQALEASRIGVVVADYDGALEHAIEKSSAQLCRNAGQYLGATPWA